MRLLPDSFYIRRAHAEDLAIAIVAAIAAMGRPLHLYMIPSGEFGVDVVLVQEAVADKDRFLVGVYDANATPGQIRDDIRACKTERPQ